MSTPLKPIRPTRRSFRFVQSKTTRRLLLFAIVLVGACTTIPRDIFKNKISEGVIEYAVSFPYLSQDDLMAPMMPKTAIMRFKEDKFATEVESMGGVFKNKLIANRSRNQVDHQMKIFKKRVRSEMGPMELKQMLNEMPHMTIIKTDQTDSIAGFNCQKALGVFDDPSRPEVTIYYTRDIELEDPNWCTPYKGLDGVLMHYEIEQFGMRMRLEAKSVNRAEIESSTFKPDSTYSKVSPEALEIEMEQLLSSFDI